MNLNQLLRSCKPLSFSTLQRLDEKSLKKIILLLFFKKDFRICARYSIIKQKKPLKNKNL